ncbi:MAG: hypothetical protein HKN04_14935 [Rhodothermaceae bacterium]|nr:hypothetical protein [Rhodothermaceae bacterium]
MRLAIQLVLAVVIAIGAYALYRTITDPWEEYQENELQTELTRARMDHIRTALIEYRSADRDYPSTLDSLVLFVRTDSAYIGEDLNEVFPMPGGRAFVPDSLPFSPRTGNPFVYQLVRDDTSGVEIYYLQDPDVPEDFIGAETPDPARRNAASWE